MNSKISPDWKISSKWNVVDFTRAHEARLLDEEVNKYVLNILETIEFLKFIAINQVWLREFIDKNTKKDQNYFKLVYKYKYRILRVINNSFKLWIKAVHQWIWHLEWYSHYFDIKISWLSLRKYTELEINEIIEIFKNKTWFDVKNLVFNNLPFIALDWWQK